MLLRLGLGSLTSATSLDCRLAPFPPSTDWKEIRLTAFELAVAGRLGSKPWVERSADPASHVMSSEDLAGDISGFRLSFWDAEGCEYQPTSADNGKGGVASGGTCMSAALADTLSSDVLERKKDRRFKVIDLRFGLDVVGVNGPPSIEYLGWSFASSLAGSISVNPLPFDMAAPLSSTGVPLNTLRSSRRP